MALNCDKCSRKRKSLNICIVALCDKILSHCAETYSEPCQTSKKKRFVRVVNGFSQNAPSYMFLTLRKNLVVPDTYCNKVLLRFATNSNLDLATVFCHFWATCYLSSLVPFNNCRNSVTTKYFRNNRSRISFIIIWDFPMFYQTFLSGNCLNFIEW